MGHIFDLSWLWYDEPCKICDMRADHFQNVLDSSGRCSYHQPGKYVVAMTARFRCPWTCLGRRNLSFYGRI
jgi:hypothetical protein